MGTKDALASWLALAIFLQVVIWMSRFAQAELAKFENRILQGMIGIVKH
jgi:hypothetical protein